MEYLTSKLITKHTSDLGVRSNRSFEALGLEN